MGTTYHVAKNGSDTNVGTKENPFLTIQKAASIALPGDVVQVHDGVYREWVEPQNGGLNECQRIVYEAAPGEHPVIKGSEVVTDWELVEGTVWKKVLSNDMFGDWNPYERKLDGDWYHEPKEYDLHLGDVYLNGVSLYEAKSLDDLYVAEKPTIGYKTTHPTYQEFILNPEQTVYQWYPQVDETNTTIYCNFQDVDPNKELIEISVRKCCFYPRKAGLNYITVRGFEMAQAACPFTPPTSDQIALLGVNWSKGWIIEKNHIHDAKCSAISIGKNATTGDNLSFKFNRKPPHYYQMEAVFLGLQLGWSKDKIGSHIIRNNVIHDCGQNAIVGHMGCAFSKIVHNHIYNIAKKHEFYGYEIAAIKLHAAIDVILENNNIHHCTLGTWLDWQAQGARVTRNLYYDNDNDFMIEVSHGPCIIDNNVFLSDFNVYDRAQGTAFVHNLFYGYSSIVPDKNRDTPYHLPHSTQVVGVTKTFGGDDRIINNLIMGIPEVPAENLHHLSSMYDEYSTPEEFVELPMSHEAKIPQAMWVEENAYAGYAKPYRGEQNPIRTQGMEAYLEEREDVWTLTVDVPDVVANAKCRAVTTERLGSPVYTEQAYENPDGTPVDFTRDYMGKHRGDDVIPGPFAKLEAGEQKIVIWQS